jgi:hypothetical protein
MKAQVQFLKVWFDFFVFIVIMPSSFLMLGSWKFGIEILEWQVMELLGFWLQECRKLQDFIVY